MPPSACSNRPRFCWRASVNAPRSWPNSSLSSSVSGMRRAGDVHERPVGAVAVEVQDLGGQVLAGAALAGQQHGRGRAGGDLRAAGRAAPPSAGDSPTMRSRRRAAPGWRAASRTSRRSCVVSSALSTISDDVVEVERLVGEVVGADLHRLDGGVDRGIGGQQDDEDVGVVLLDLAQHGDAVDVGQLVVEQHEIDAVARRARAPPGRSALRPPRSRRCAAARPATSESAVRRRRRGSLRCGIGGSQL